MTRQHVDTLGRHPLEDLDPRNEEEEEEDAERAFSAESWILSGGSWKKRRESANDETGGNSQGDTKTSASSFPNHSHRIVGKLQPPTARTFRALSPPSSRALSPSSARALSLSPQPPRAISPASPRTLSPVAATTLSPVAARTLSPLSQRALSPLASTLRNNSRAMTAESSFASDVVSTASRSSARSRVDLEIPSHRSISSRVSEGGGSKASTADTTRYSARTAQTDPVRPVMATMRRSSSGLSAVSSKASAETRRSNRTSQTEPVRIYSGNSTSMVPSSHVPEVIVEEKKRRSKKPSKKPAQSWIQEKDDFFSATRFSDSVARSASRASVPNDIKVTKKKYNMARQQEETASQGSTRSTSSRTPPKHDIFWASSARSPLRSADRPSSPFDEERPTKQVPRVASPTLEITSPGSAIERRRQRAARSVSPRSKYASTASSDQRPPEVSLPPPPKNLSIEMVDGKVADTPKRGSSRFRESVRSPSPNARSFENTLDEIDHSEGLPMLHVTAIRQCFGFDCDIYRDVLKVGRNASDKQLRIAYFRRGRNVLAEHKDLVRSPKDNSSIASLKYISAETKEKFQAVSLAFEIISEPEWRALYDKQGWDAPLINVPPKKLSLLQSAKRKNNSNAKHGRAPNKEPSSKQSSRARSISPILRSSVVTPDERRSRSTGRGITWSEQVEELVFRQDPEELEARRIKSPPPEPSMFDDDWMHGDIDGRMKSSSFMANFLNDLDHSLDGLEASLDGLWSMSSAGESKESRNEAKAAPAVPDRTEMSSPVSLETQASKSVDSTTTEDDTIPSKLTENGQCSNSRDDEAPAPESWDGVASTSSSTLPSTIHPDEDDSEDLTVQQLYEVLTQQSSDRRRKRESQSRKERREPVIFEGVVECASPSDVKKLHVQDDDSIERAFSDPEKEFEEKKSLKVQSNDHFNPFEDTMSTIRDAEFESSSPSRKGTSHRPSVSVIVEDEDSVASSPSRMKNNKSSKMRSPLQNDELFSKDLPEFRDLTVDESSEANYVDASFRTQSEVSSITGIPSNSSFTSSHKNKIENSSARKPGLRKPGGGERRTLRGAPVKEESPGNTDVPCDTDFLSHLFCYADALSSDLNSFGNDFASKLSATQDMILESLTFTENNVTEVVKAMDIPEVERSNTI